MRYRALWLGLALLLGGCSAYEKPPFCPVQSVPSQPSSAGAGGALYTKALEYEKWAEALQPVPYGGMVNSQFTGHPNLKRENVVAYNDLQDSTIWTGTYLAAESFRYAATGDPEAKENVRRAAQTLHFFLKVTCKPGVLPRYAGCLTEPAKAYVGACEDTGKKPCYLISNPTCDIQKDNQCGSGTPLFWYGGTSRDQYTGWFFGMGIAYRLSDDPDLRQMIREDVKEVIEALYHWKFVIHGPDGKPTQAAPDVLPNMRLSWLMVASDILRDDPKYCQWYEEEVKKNLALALVDNYSGLNRYYQYYGFNLDFLNNYNLILLEPNPERKKAYLDAFREGAYRFVEGTGNSLYDYVYMAASGVSNRQILKADHKSLELFLSAPNVMQPFQPPKARLSRASWALYRLNKLFHFKQEFYPQAREPYPLDQRCPVDFIWQQSPYQVCCFKPDSLPTPVNANWPPSESRGACKNSIYAPNWVYPGADYLLAYWMGRYHGFLTAEH